MTLAKDLNLPRCCLIPKIAAQRLSPVEHHTIDQLAHRMCLTDTMKLPSATYRVNHSNTGPDMTLKVSIGQ